MTAIAADAAMPFFFMLRLSEFFGQHGFDSTGLTTGTEKAIAIVLFGERMVNFSGSDELASVGDVFLLDDSNALVIPKGNMVVGYMIVFEQIYLDYFLLHYPLARGIQFFTGLLRFRLSDEELQNVTERLKMLQTEVDRGSGFDHLKMLFSLLLLDLFRDSISSNPFDGDKILQGIFQGLLERNFRSKRKSGFYAGEMSISGRKLNALCRSFSSGKRFDEVLRHRLLSEAEYRLLSSGEPIKVIAYDLGFCSIQHFRDWFKRLKGVSPTLFKKDHTPKD